MNIQEFMSNKNEKPLDKLVTDGGFCSIFRTIGCVGDSLASGEFELVDKDGNKSYHDLYEYSWGQYIARMAGCKAYNFSKGGMTADVYCESFAEERNFWDKEKACQAYIIALGVNDLFGQSQEIGGIDDICMEDYRKNKHTFAGYYAQIIQRLKEISPDARFFMVTFPKDTDHTEEKDNISQQHAKLLYDLSKVFTHSYVIDLYKYAPVYDKKFKEQFYLNGHLNPCGYNLTAKMFASYIDYIVRNNMDDFRKTGIIGTGIETGI